MQEAAQLGALLKRLAGLFGFLQSDADAYFQASAAVDVNKIEALIAARQTARLEKNWAEADRIRQELQAMNIVLDDTANGVTTWKHLE